MELKFGKVTEIVDSNKFIVKFTVEDDIEDAVAYPIDTFDEPNVGDPIQIYGIDTVFGMSFVYQKQRLFDHTRIKLGEQMVDITDHNVTITSALETEDDGTYGDSDDGVKVATGKGRTIEIDADGKIVVHSGKNTEVTIDKNLNIEVKGAAKINVTNSCELKARTVTVDAKMLQIKGAKNVAPNPAGGPFCAIKICPYTGMPHTGDVAM